jgi:hypothetical protein
MSAGFRARAKGDFERLLEQWRTIELWLKKAEQVNKAALIPAINELRYSGRQLFNAITLFDGSDNLTPLQMRQVEKRITIAEQYLFNAEHDIADAIAGFYDQAIETLDREISASLVTQYYPEYPLMKQKLVECNLLISEARHDYAIRGANYGRMRGDHLPYLIQSYRKLLDAEISARHYKEQVDAELVRLRAKTKLLEWVGFLGALASIIAVPIAIYLWTLAYDDYCKLHGTNRVLGMLCSQEKSSAPAKDLKSPAPEAGITPPAANIPSIAVTPATPVRPASP